MKVSTPDGQDYFSLFNLPRAPRLDAAELARRYRTLQQRVHPDRFAGAAELERQVALQQASRINDAYAVLKQPLARAAYLLSLYGADVYDETNTAMPPEFLEQQMEWREALEEQDPAARAALCRQIAAVRDETAAAAENALEALVAGAGGDTVAATAMVRQWVYLEKLLAAESG